MSGMFVQLLALVAGGSDIGTLLALALVAGGSYIGTLLALANFWTLLTVGFYW